MAGFIFLIVLALQIISAVFISGAAQEKGHSGKGTFWLSFLLGPVGWVYAMALPDLKQRKNQERIIELLEKSAKIQVSESKDQVEKVALNDELPPL